MPGNLYNTVPAAQGLTLSARGASLYLRILTSVDVRKTVRALKELKYI